MIEEATRDRLLDAAERLFAVHGYQATTMRGLTAEAEANIAAVNYHFGCKQSLLEAVVHRALAPVVEERRRRLAALGEDPSVEDVVDAIVGPLFDCAEAAPLLGRLFVDPDPEMRCLVRAELAESSCQRMAVLERALPDVPREELWLRLRAMYAVVGGHLTGSFGPCERRQLVTFLAAGLRAPATA
jgi:AcrR family transcriptional regulator